MIKLALLTYVITATVLFELAATGLLLAGACSLKNGKLSVERTTGEQSRMRSQFLSS
jgi:hypothetical protein